jgi:hypothetical protein
MPRRATTLEHVDIPDYEPEFEKSIKDFWATRERQAAKQLAGGKTDAGTRGAVTGGKQLDAVAVLIARVMTDAGLERPRNKVLPGYYRRSKNWDIVARFGQSIAAIVELKSQIGSIGNNANNRIEEMIGQAVDLWKANREKLLGNVTPWFGYLMLVEDSPVSRRIAAHSVNRYEFPRDPVFEGTNYIDRYRLALERLRHERDMDEVCLVASSRDGEIWYPDSTMTFHAFATAIHARGSLSEVVA